MAKKSSFDESPEVAPASEASASEPRPPQGITPRPMASGDARKDFHPYFRQVEMIDPASLKRDDGEDPFLALPIPGKLGEKQRFRIRQVPAVHAAQVLSCDRTTGGPPTCRLATDAEVEQYHREMEARRAKR